MKKNMIKVDCGFLNNDSLDPVFLYEITSGKSYLNFVLNDKKNNEFVKKIFKKHGINAAMVWDFNETLEDGNTITCDFINLDKNAVMATSFFDEVDGPATILKRHGKYRAYSYYRYYTTCLEPDAAKYISLEDITKVSLECFKKIPLKTRKTILKD